ncbi:hypothetical protein J5N97_023209 [Dioscorea zingiberensis]|uniref:Uncharacterized protein n=1 Tax=Dioscorea zingiberensis TaxID=325984 RepID=A0A9D5CCY4_9LILI|nr:hypothetical protein J5N97_023209 [Dioscorea zingiberensis]
MEGAFEKNRIKPVITVKQQSHKFIQVKGDGSFVPAYEDEVTQDKNLSAEKQSDTTSLDDAMYFHMDVTDGYFGIGDIPWEIDNYIGKIDCNASDSTNANGGKQEVEHKYVDSTFGGDAADRGTLHLIPDHLDNVFGSASPGSSQPNCPSYCGSQVENLSSKCRNQSFGKSTNPVKVLDLTVLESTSDPKTMFLEDMSTPELHEAFDTAFGWDTCLNNEEWLRHCILFGFDDFTENDDSVLGLIERNDDSVLGLIERELPVMKNENSKMDDFKANNTQVPSSDSISTSTSRSGPCDDSTYYASLDGSSDDSVEIFRKAKIRSKRKNHRQWTLDEITQLIDGVSQYGVGKWTYIKRFSFSTSSYRTSVDLKDKWRNLLRASGVQMKGSKVKPQKNRNVPIPESVLRRVKELSNIYPYPRGQKADACDDSQSSRAIS